MAYSHAPGYVRLDTCELVACADIVEENAAAFAEEFAIDEENVYTDGVEMVTDADVDVVSVVTPVPTHAPIVLDVIRNSSVAAIHCEKPMATSWGDARMMTLQANREDVQLTFNHQRRMVSPYRDVLELLDSDRIGEFRRIEVACGEILDNGTHYIDLANMYNGQTPIDWVLGGIDYREEHVKYGAHNENQALAQWQYENGVDGLATTGYGEDFVGANLRLLGTEGEIVVRPDWSDDTQLAVRGTNTEDWETVEYATADATDIELAIEHVIESLAAGEAPELSARNALDATEVIFGTYESSRRRGRVEFPLEVADNPLEKMVETGALQPRSSDDE
jgi:predicted dehydrogenase